MSQLGLCSYQGALQLPRCSGSSTAGNLPGAFQGLSLARSPWLGEHTQGQQWGEGTKRVPVSPVPAPKGKETKLGVTL